MNRTKRGFTLIGAGAIVTALLTACGGGTSGDGGPIELTVALSVPESHASAIADTAWMNAVTEATDGDVTFDITYNGGLCAATEIAECVSTGVADMGYTVPSYHPAELPLTNVSSIGFVSPDINAQAQAMKELYETTPEIAAEYEDWNLKMLYFEPSGVPVIGETKTGLTEVNDLQGTKVRATGAYIDAVANAGGSPVTIDLNEIYDALEKNVIDGTTLPVYALPAFQLDEVLTEVYDIGQYVGSIAVTNMVMNQGIWDSLSVEQQEAMQSVTEDFMPNWTQDYYAPETIKACQTLEDAGIMLTPLAESSDHEEWVESTQTSQVDKWKDASGLDDGAAQELFESYTSLVEEYSTPEGDKSSLQLCE